MKYYTPPKDPLVTLTAAVQGRDIWTAGPHGGGSIELGPNAVIIRGESAKRIGETWKRLTTPVEMKPTDTMKTAPFDFSGTHSFVFESAHTPKDQTQIADIVGRLVVAEETLFAIQSALGTAETGNDLVEVARNAHRAEREYAAKLRKESIEDGNPP